MDRTRLPSKRQWALEPLRAGTTVAALMRARAVLNACPPGDGRPVMLLPGLFNSDRSNFAMRRFLNRLGYHAVGWGLGRNFGARTIGRDGERIFERISALHDGTGERVTLIGISLGGLIARLAAHRMPGAVREVITVASPYAGDPRATNVWRFFEWFTGERIDDPSVLQRSAEITRPLPVPATAIWSRSDGLVNGSICHNPNEAGCRSIEIDGSHLAIQLRPTILVAIADVLAGRDPPAA